MIDLHLHSRFSDGALTPTELVERARVRGLYAIALTDHDTVDGNPEALEAGARRGVKVIPGVEFSVQVGEVAVHLLGYGVGALDAPAQEAIRQLKEGREKLLTRIVSRLNDLGVPLSSEEVRREAGGSVIGRLHIARALVNRRFVGNVRDAFTQYVGRGAKAYVDRPRLSAMSAVQLVHSLGAVAVLAHPGVVEREYPGKLAEVLDALTAEGMDGIEAYYSSHTVYQTGHFLDEARRRNLLVTGGSDFHRPDPDGPEIGTGTGRLKVPREALTALEAAMALRKAAIEAQ